MMYENLENIAWDKMQGLLPVIVQDATSLQVLMLGYMNLEALEKTLTTGFVTFYSRSKQRLWTKGESSGNFLKLISIVPDCDNDCLLIQALPEGVVCHTGAQSCFINENKNEQNTFPNLGKTIVEKQNALSFLMELEQIIQHRFAKPQPQSYTSQLFAAGISRISQKVGEEGLEVALAAVQKNTSETLNEAADLIFHLLVLLVASEIPLNDVLLTLVKRHKTRLSQ